MRNKNHLFFYIFGIVLSILISFYVIDLKIEPKNNERFGLLIGSYDITINKDDLSFPKSIKKTTIKNATGFNLSVFVTAQSESKDYDLFFLSEEDAKTDNFYHSVLPLDENDINTVFDSPLNYLSKDNVIYGIEITEKLQKYNKTPLSTPFYACFMPNSVHGGIFTNSQSDLSISIIKNL